MMRILSDSRGVIAAGLTLLLVLVACSGKPEVPPAGDPNTDGTGNGPQIVSFTATGLELGEGEWLLAWETVGDSITLNGMTVEAKATLEVPASATTYDLSVRTGTETAASSLTVGPVTGVAITDNHGRASPFALEPAGTLQLQASVSAAEASVPPSQSVTWHSDPPGIVDIDSEGLVTATGLGSTRVYATSRQYTDRFSYAELQVVDLPEIASFAALPVEDGSGSWSLEWSADAEEITLNGVSVELNGSTLVSPASAVTYELVAVNGEWTIDQSITLAPVSGFTVAGLGNPPQLGLGQSRTLEASVHATGSDVQPSQAVRFTSLEPEILGVTEDGVLTGVSRGTARLRVASIQDEAIFEEIQVEVLGAGLYDLAVTGASDELEAGDGLSLTWTAVALDSLTVTAVSGGVSGPAEQILPPSASGLDVVVPLHEGSVNYRFDWETVTGTTGSQMLWDTEQQILGWVCNRPDQQVTFTDPVIEEEVRRIFTPGPIIYCDDVQVAFPPSLNEYGQETHNMVYNNRCATTPGPRVESLEGIQHLIHLTRLELECNEIVDISRLASMTGLVEINFDNNEIVDLSPLADLVNVRVLGLYNNNVADIASLANLANLEILYLSENHVVDISPLGGLLELRHVWLYLNCRTLIVDSWSDCLRDVSPLAGLTQVQSLVFHMNEIEDISFIHEGMTQLQLVVATGNRIAEIDVLADLPNLVTLAVDDNYLTTLEPLVQNQQFGAQPPYTWTRGTVSMPPQGHELNGLNLAMGYNCFDPTVAPFADQLATLASRGAVIAGDDVSAKACGLSSTSTGIQQYRKNLLDTWRSPH